jgi:uncharacterized protein involved in outer membrane biogenesis
MSTVERFRWRRWLIAGLGVFVGLFAAALITVALFDWNQARGWIGQQVKERTGRDFVIAGDLRVRPFSLHPKVHAERVSIGNADWGEKTPLIEADTLDFSVSLRGLLRRHFVFPDVTLGEAKVLLQRDREGRRNWILTPAEQKTGESSDPEIHRLTVNRGQLTVKDLLTDTDAVLDIETLPNPNDGVRFTAKGRIKSINAQLKGTGGALLSLLDESQPYPMKIEGSLTDAKASFDGAIHGLATLSTIDARLTLAGGSLGKLGDALRISLPETAPYKLSGRLHREGEVWKFTDFRGVVGASDLGGEFTVDVGKKRPTLGGKLTSNLLDIKDLGGFIGAAPGAQKHVQPAGKVLPHNTINLEKLRRVDAHVTLAATKFQNPRLPLDKLNAKLDLEDGVFKLQPIDFGVAGGTLSSRVTVNAQQRDLAVDIDSRFRQLHIAQLVPRAELLEKSFGAINGRARLKGHGNSAASVLGTSNGRVDLLSGGGEMSNLLLEFAGADLAEIVKFWMGGDQQVALRCGVASFHVENGVMRNEVFVIDTDDTYFGGAGAISLKDETLDLKITPLPKDFSPVVLRGPLYVRGTFDKPAFGLEKKTLMARAGGALLLGLLNPLAAIIPLIETGPGKDAPCAGLVQQLEARIKASDPPKRATRPG